MNLILLGQILQGAGFFNVTQLFLLSALAFSLNLNFLGVRANEEYRKKEKMWYPCRQGIELLFRVLLTSLWIFMSKS